MPLHKQDGGWQWGEHGKVYKGKKAKEKAIKQAVAINYSLKEKNKKAHKI